MGKELSVQAQAPATEPSSSAGLVASLKQGDPRATTEFYRSFAPKIRGTLYSILGPHQDTPDLLQEVFYRALKRIATLRDPSCLSSWLVSIAVRVARESIRRRPRGFELELSRHDSDMAVYPAYDERHVLRKVYKTMRRQPGEEQIILGLHWLEERSLKEVASILGCSESTAKRRFQKARKRFLKLAESEPEIMNRLKGSDDA